MFCSSFVRPLEKSSQNKRLLVVHQGALGDIVTALPCIAAAKSSLGLDADFWCQAPYLALLKKMGIAQSGLGVESGAIAGLFSKTPSQRALGLLSGCDAAIYFGNSPELIESLKMAIPKVYCLEPRPAPGQRVRVGKALARQMLRAGLIKDLSPPSPELGAGRRLRSGPILLHPGAGSPRKCWPAAKFAAICKKAASAGLKAAFVLGPADHRLQKELLNLGVSSADIHAGLSLENLWETLLACRAFVGNDSGVTHLAALADAPFVAVFGPSDPLRWAPAGRGRVLRAGTDCLPCFELEGKNCQKPVCLETEVETVWQALQEVIAIA